MAQLIICFYNSVAN